MRGSVTGFKAGDKVEVWFEAGGKARSSSPSPRRRWPRHQVLILAAEDYSGLSPNTAPDRRPELPRDLHRALADAGIPADVYDIDAHGRTQADLLGVLGHYKAVIWYTGIDDFVRDPGQTVGISKLFDDQMIAVRDYLNEGGKVLVTGQRALEGAWSQYALQPARPVPGQAAVPFEHQLADRAGPDRPARELRAGVQRLPAVLDGRERAGHAGVDSATASARDDRRPGAVHEHVLADGPVVPAALHADSSSLSPAAFPHFAVPRPTHRSLGSTNARRRVDRRHAAVGLRPGEHRRPRDTRKALVFEGLGSLGVNPYTQTHGRRWRHRAGHAVADARAPARRSGRFTPGVDEGVHGVDDRQRHLDGG